jgi:hypothetical protein
MRFSAAFVLLLTVVSASPLPKKEKAAASSSVSSAVASSTAAAASSTSTATAAAGGSVLSAAAYNDFQISSGTAGNAQTEANALFSGIDMNNLASVSAADLKIIKGIHDVAEDAEVQAFNPAVEAASGDAATALQVSSFLYLWVLIRN